MTRVSTFFQDKILMCLNPWLDNRVQDLIDVYLLAHLFVCIAWYFVEIDLRPEIMPNRCPTMIAFFVLLGRLIVLLNAVLAITHTWLSNDVELILGAIAKMRFIAEPYCVPILWLRISLQHNRRPMHYMGQNFGEKTRRAMSRRSSNCSTAKPDLLLECTQVL